MLKDLKNSFYPTNTFTNLKSPMLSASSGSVQFTQDESDLMYSKLETKSGPNTQAHPPQDSTFTYLNDLTNYVPLGTLRLRANNVAEANLQSDVWKEASTYPCVARFLHYHQPKFSPLLRYLWVRVLLRQHPDFNDLAILRYYILPDDVGRRYLDRDNSKLRKLRMDLVRMVDCSNESWIGILPKGDPKSAAFSNYLRQSCEHDSLFYLFNTLPSPTSDIQASSKHAQKALIDILDDVDGLDGLKTKLYPYQQRSAAMMIRREAQPTRDPDPRFESLTGPMGHSFYYDRETGNLDLNLCQYEQVRGGILAETMGYGKTLICLAAVLATKGHCPQIPPEASLGLHPVRPKVGTLMEMAASGIGRGDIPWRSHFRQLSAAGEHYKSCLEVLEENIASYVILRPSVRSQRQSTVTPEKRISICSTTLVVAPANLITQWRQEIATHIEPDALRVLVIDSYSQTIPDWRSLAQYDIILLSKQRFEREVPNEEKPGYHSPLRDLHFLRIIVDEGHDFSSTSTNTHAMTFFKQLRVERRWVVSGTPAGGLLGVEVGLAANETYRSTSKEKEEPHCDTLVLRRTEIATVQERKDLEKFGNIVAKFLQVRPWANNDSSYDKASWQRYILPSADGQRKVFPLRKTLESVVVRHRIEDVEADLTLPKLYNRVVRLKPSWHDKLTQNLFVLSLVVNAVTSERVDKDYMFHPNNRKELQQVINNLRYAGFYWTGFSQDDITEAIKHSWEYFTDGLQRSILPEQSPSMRRPGDQKLLEDAIEIGEKAIASQSWVAFSKLDEIGLYVADFPKQAREAWTMVPQNDGDPLLIGTTQLIKAQQSISSHMYSFDPIELLIQDGKSEMHEVREVMSQSIPDHSDGQLGNSPPTTATKVKGTTKRAMKRAKKLTISGPQSLLSLSNGEPDLAEVTVKRPHEENITKPLQPKSILKRRLSVSRPPQSIPALAKTTLCGTASAKLSYLLDRLLSFYRQEKTLIFYEGEHIAYYIAQALDVVNIPHLIYAKSLTVSRRNTYITTFNERETFRVLLMDAHQAAHGLHIASASRVFFVNPIWQPNVEAQAIKRAHRIGQTRPVYAETLVLEDTLEDKMLQRRQRMNPQEHHKAEKSLLDDATMRNILEDARFIPFTPEELSNVDHQFAKLQSAPLVFGQCTFDSGGIEDPDADLVLGEDPSIVKPKRRDGSKKAPSSNAIAFGDPNTSNAMMGTDAEIHEPASTCTKKQSPQLTGSPKTKPMDKTKPLIPVSPSGTKRIGVTFTDNEDYEPRPAKKRVGFSRVPDIEQVIEATIAVSRPHSTFDYEVPDSNDLGQSCRVGGGR